MTTNIQINAVKGIYDTIDPSKNLGRAAEGKVVMITGAGRGIGRAIAEAFTRASATSLILCALEESELVETQKIAQKIKPSVRVFLRGLDVRDTTAVETFVSDAASWANGRIDVLCNNAGISPPIQDIATSDPMRWWLGLEVNLKGPYLFSRFVLPIMLEAGGGHIITTASRAATMTECKMSSYQIGKLGAVRLSELIHNEYNDRGIKAMAIHPGGIVTQLLTDMERETETWAQGVGKLIRPQLQETISLPGNACVFLASGRADFLSGRYVDSTIDFDQLVQQREAIVKNDLFKVGIAGNWNKDGGFVTL
ncbi:hypothetical protein BKA65DRAFT_579082 [Rhexocercosporidium sp. MPI-PUGE-AT-0058]|nr:hypothetical protein BKA65DRAFT_579082 [Rhexocercosporidium sp. MPI-PUGE-AT-0058]